MPPQDPQHPFAPFTFRNFLQEGISQAPPPPDTSPPAGENGEQNAPAKPFEITNDLLKSIQGTIKRQPYSYDVSDPYDYAKRYMNGWGHSGYVGPASEDFNAQRQGIGSKWVNGLAKFAGNTLTTAIAGTAGLLDGIAETGASIFSPGGVNFSKLFDNTIDRAMQSANDWQEQQFPHFQTDKERNAYVWSPDNWATANFWANGFLKNLGFAAGAMITGELGGLALARVPEVTEWALTAGKSLMTGDFARDYKLMEQTLSMLGNADDVTKAQAIKEIAMNPNKLEEIGISAERLAKVGKFDTQFRNTFNQYAISTLGAFGESNMEAIQGIQSIRDQLTQKYKDVHNGDLPDPATADRIEQQAREGSNWRWLLNMLTLSVTNNIEFPRLLSNGVKEQMGVFNKETSDIAAITTDNKIAGSIARPGETYADAAAIRSAERSTIMKIINPVYQFVKNPIAVSEAVEEGLQYAYEKGTESYEQMKYDKKSASLYHEIISTGMHKVFHDKEGIESMIFGGLTGKLMDVVLGGSERAAVKKNTRDLLDVLNSSTYTVVGDISGAAQQEQYLRENKSAYIEALTASNIRHGAIAAEQGKAVAKGDIERMQSLDADFMTNIALPRIIYGRKDVFKEELRQYMSGNMPFAKAKELLKLPDNVTSEDLDKSIQKRLKQVDNLALLHEFVQGSFGTQRSKDGNRKYTDQTIEDMTYNLFKVADQDERFNKLTEQIEADTGVDLSALTDYKKRKAAPEGKEDLDTLYNTIHKNIMASVKEAVRSDPTKQKDKNGIDIFDKVKDLETVINDRERYVRDYEMLRNQTTDELNKPLSDHPTVEQLEAYERRYQYPMLLNQMLATTASRRIATSLSQALEALDDKNTDKVLRHLATVRSLLANKNAFLYAHDISHLRQITSTIKDKLFEQAKMDIPLPADTIPGFATRGREDALHFAETEPEASDIAEQEGTGATLTDEQANYLNHLAEHYKELVTPLKSIEDAIDELADRGEPVTPKISEIRRRIADGFMNTYDEIRQSMTNEANTDYRDNEQIEKALESLKWMKELYGDRKDLLATKAFKAQPGAKTGSDESYDFIPLLDKRIKELEDWLGIVNKRLDNIMRADSDYARNRANGQWGAMGIDLTKEVAEPAAAETVAATTPSLTAEQQEAKDKELKELAASRDAAIASAKTPTELEFISEGTPSLYKVIDIKDVTSPDAGGETIKMNITIKTEQDKIKADYKIYEQLTKCL